MLKSVSVNEFLVYPQALWISLCMSGRIAPRKARCYAQLFGLAKI